MHVEVTDGDVVFKLTFKELQEVQIRLGSTDTFPLDYQINFVFPHPKKAG